MANLDERACLPLNVSTSTSASPRIALRPIRHPICAMKAPPTFKPALSKSGQGKNSSLTGLSQAGDRPIQSANICTQYVVQNVWVSTLNRSPFWQQLNPSFNPFRQRSRLCERRRSCQISNAMTELHKLRTLFAAAKSTF